MDPGAAYHRSAHRKQTWHLAASSRLVKDRAILGILQTEVTNGDRPDVIVAREPIMHLSKPAKVIGARWSEIDMDAAVWTVPEGRMQAQREHRVPLSQEAIRVLKAAKKLQSDDEVEVVFEGLRGKAMSNTGMSAVLKRMRRDDVTVHGFRSTFRDWCAEQTAFPREIAEAALAHVLTNKAEAAYQRGDLLERRRTLMAAWARFATTLPRAKQASNVTPISRACGQREK